MLKMLSKAHGKRANGETGFTLIELLVVVVIIGILIAIAIPLYLNYRKGANDKAAESDLRGAISVIEVCRAENGRYPYDVVFGDGTGPGFQVTGCVNGWVIMSKGSYQHYSTDFAFGTYYSLAFSNYGGSGKIYCYDSNVGGSIKVISAASVAVATC